MNIINKTGENVYQFLVIQASTLSPCQATAIAKAELEARLICKDSQAIPSGRNLFTVKSPESFPKNGTRNMDPRS